MPWKPRRNQRIQPVNESWASLWAPNRMIGKKLDARMDVQHLNEKGEVSCGKSVRVHLRFGRSRAPPLKRYCRKVYELGYIPICPRLSDGQYLALESPDEKRTFYSIARQKLGRCRMLVVCGNEISTAMTAEIGQAEKRNLICTTLDGLAKIKEMEE